MSEIEIIDITSSEFDYIDVVVFFMILRESCDRILNDDKRKFNVAPPQKKKELVTA